MENKFHQTFISFGPCADLTSIDELVECMEDNAYMIDEVLDTQEDKESEMVDLIKPDAWQESISNSILGKCFTLKAEKGAIGFNQKTALYFHFSSSLEYYLMLHDQDFYLFTSNPKTFPRVLLSLDKRFGQR